MKTQDRTVTIGDYRFSEEKHLHELMKDGEYKPLTGVTTVLGVIAKPMLIQWSANMAVEYVLQNKTKFINENSQLVTELLDEVCKEARVAHRKKKESAGEWGTNIHTLAEEYINICTERGGEALMPVTEAV